MQLKKVRFYLLFTLILMAFMNADAQPTGDPTGDPDATPVQEVPIDGGLTLLLGAGVAYGAKRAYDHKKRARREE